jgi:hypothetical protein
MTSPEVPLQDSALNAFLPRTYPRTASQWSVREQAFYEKILAAQHFDVLIVPVQIQHWGFDWAMRLLMTAEIASAIAEDQRLRIPDPFLVAKLFGEGQRAVSPEEVARVAQVLGVKRVVLAYAGQDRGHLQVTLIAMDQPAQEPPSFLGKNRRRLDKYFVEDNLPPIEAFESVLPELLRAVGFEPPAAPVHASSGALEVEALPEAPLQLFSSKDAVHDAYALFLLDSLVPRYIERAKARFAVEAFLATNRIAPASPEYRALRARAYMSLGYRPVALKLLEQPHTDEERALLAALQGDLPSAVELAAKEKNPVKQLIETLDAITIASHYDVADRTQIIARIRALKLPGKIWTWLAMRAATDWDSGSQFDNASLKLLLDHDFPIPGYTMQDIVQGALSIKDPERAVRAADLAPFNHVRRYLENAASEASRSESIDRLNGQDYLALLEAIGHDNLMRRLHWLTHMQSRPQAAIEMADSIDAVYNGDTYYELERAKAERAVADASGGAEREGLMHGAYARAFNALVWEQSQSLIAAEAMTELGSTGRHDYGYFDNLYHSDLPYHPGFILWSDGGDRTAIRRNALAALENATSEFAPVRELLNNDSNQPAEQSDIDAVMQSISGRFIGDPERSWLLADQEARRGNAEAAVALLRAGIRSSPNYEPLYASLDRVLVESGDVNEAQRVALSYPGFRKDSNANPLQVAYAGFEMGTTFYAAGYLDLATPLYRISASQDTGSASEMAAQARLELLAGHLEGAMQESLARAQRYNDASAFRDYLSMLHALRHSNEAWSAFGELVREIPEQPQTWEAALVGHHVTAQSEADVVQWAKRAEFKAAGARLSYAAEDIVRFATTDRTPSQALAKEITEIDRPIFQLEDDTHDVVRPTADGRWEHILGPNRPDAYGMLRAGVFSGSRKHQVTSDLAYFVEGYRALQLKQFKESKAAFDEALTLYDPSSAASYMLPYYALAAAQAGDTGSVEAVLARLSPGERKFDYQLARGVIDAVAGRLEDAVRELRLARLQRPSSDERVLLTQYTYGDVCALLFEATHQSRIRELALDWAKKRQKIEPWQSWSFALEAKLALDGKDRQRAIAMTRYLDPGSETLRKFSKSEIEAAVAEFGRENIFLSQPTHRKADQGI